MLRAYDHDPRAESYGLEAAAALGVDPAPGLQDPRGGVDGALAVAVVPVVGTARPQGARAGARREPRGHGRPRGGASAPPATSSGGISPVGQRRRLPTVVDESALAHPTVLVSAGRRGLDLEIAPADLVAVTGAITGSISRRS